jgi:two-component system OmpR family response regulator
MQQPVNILVVEDSFPIATRLKSILEEIEAVNEIRHAATLAEAWEMLQLNRVEIMILDISLPDGSGLNFLELVKKNYKLVCVIMFSNHAGRQERELARRNGADHFLDKSLDFDKIAPIIDTVARSI